MSDATMAADFRGFLDEYVSLAPMARYTEVGVLHAAFHHFCRTVAGIEPPTFSEFRELLDRAGYLPHWVRDSRLSEKPVLIVRGLRLDTSVPREK
ncbi:hypothetical protein ACFU5O_22240 [Streptomyces sp. NPDC057445]|uniref:hypothetical protein n=1 Tax=Streptomyces sp. NPDC057445 TaxID=3346136 RepID=UPI00367B235B